MRRSCNSNLGVAGLCACACLSLIGCEPFAEPFEEKAYPRIAINGIEVQAPPNIQIRPPVLRRAPTASKITVVAVDPEPAFRVVRVRVSSYCPCSRCCQRMTGLTSTQTNAWRPGIAADPTWLPYGTVVSVPGYADRESIDDTGGKMKRKWWTGEPRMDVRFSYHWQARDWGVQYLDVKVYKSR